MAAVLLRPEEAAVVLLRPEEAAAMFRPLLSGGRVVPWEAEGLAGGVGGWEPGLTDLLLVTLLTSSTAPAGGSSSLRPGEQKPLSLAVAPLSFLFFLPFLQPPACSNRPGGSSPSSPPAAGVPAPVLNSSTSSWEGWSSTSSSSSSASSTTVPSDVEAMPIRTLQRGAHDS